MTTLKQYDPISQTWKSILAGQKGEQGLPGAKGDKGDKGDQGLPGNDGLDGIQYLLKSETHTYAIAADGNSDFNFVPFAVSVRPNEQLWLDRVIARCSSGTPTLRVMRGTDIAISGIAVSSTQTVSDPENIVLANNQEIDVECTAGDWSDWLYVTIVMLRQVNSV